MDDAELSMIEAARAIARGAIAAEAYANALLARAEAHAGLNAFVHLDAEAVRAAARAADARRARGGPRGPLHGIPLALKDNIEVREVPTGAGTPALRDHRPGRDAPVVRRLFEAGAFLLGKTNMHELAYGITTNNAAFGPTRNPFDPARIPGGSSGGTAAAVAARIAPAGLGTDTGGSVRIPAALCGLVGFRPTVGRYPGAGIVPISHTRDTAGPIARNVADAALLDAILAGDSGALAPASLARLRLGVPRGYFADDLEAETARAFEAALGALEAAGARLIEADIPDVAALERAVGLPVALYETARELPRHLEASGAGVELSDLARAIASPDVKAIFETMLGPGAVSEAVYREAIEVHRPALQRRYAEYFASHEVAAIAFPTTPLPAARIGLDDTVALNGRQVSTFATFIRNTGPGSNAGIPGLSLPMGVSPAGLPLGLELDGPAFSDRALLSIGLAIEAADARFRAPALPREGEA